MTEKVIIVIESSLSYPIFNFADTLTTVRRGKRWTVSLTGTNDGDGIHFFLRFEEKEKFDTVGLSTMWFVLIVLFLMTVKIEQILWCL